MRVITKDMRHVMGVYGIRRISYGLFYYIGSSKDVWDRWIGHKYRKTLHEEKTTKEYYAFHEIFISNLDDFEPVLLDELVGFIHMDDKTRLRKRLVDREIMYIRKYKALGHPLASPEENQDGTRKHTKETKDKISAKHIGIKRSEEAKAKIRGDNNPAKRPEVRAKMSAARTGIKRSEETKAKIRGDNNPAFGTKWMHKPNEKPIMVKKYDIEKKKEEGYIFGMK